MKPLPALDLIANFDALPSDAIVPTRVAALMLNVSEWTLRRQKPLKQIRMSARRVGFRVGDIRTLVRQSAATHAAA